MSEAQIMAEQPIGVGQEPIIEVPGATHTVERKPIKWEPSASDKADTFCKIMRHSDAPASFNVQIIQRLKEWKLIDENYDPTGVLGNYEEYRKVIWAAEAEAEKSPLPFIKAFGENPWNFDGCVEGEYTEAELPEHFPRATEIQKILPGDTKFSFRAEPGEFYLRLVIREDGRKQVLRIVNTTRDAEAINADAKQAPSIIPPFEAIKLSDGKTGLLIQWVEGHMPSTPEEKALCLTHAEELLKVPIDSYDLWAGNFLLSDEVDAKSNLPKVYYIDKDIPETIAEKGYDLEIPEDRKQAFISGKEKMK